MSSEYSDLLLGKDVAPAEGYAPHLLTPIARALGRRDLDASILAQCSGVDVWHAYELSWLASGGVPQVSVGQLCVPADSPNMVESKSLKLYFNSLNSSHFASPEAFCALVERDLSQVAGAPVGLSLMDVDMAPVNSAGAKALCLDHLQPTPIPQSPDVSLLRLTGASAHNQSVYSHLMRSLCPVTGQPDWATLWLRYSGPEIDPASLLAYVLGFREHQEFHEQCIERIFCDVYRACSPTQLEVQGSYLRRGGLDINPYRSTRPTGQPWPRMARQ